jgi:hypothetical protein
MSFSNDEGREKGRCKMQVIKSGFFASGESALLGESPEAPGAERIRGFEDSSEQNKTDEPLSDPYLPCGS